MATDKLELNVAGMTCVNCSNAIEKVTAKMDGVEEAKVSFASSKAEFIIDPTKVKIEDIKQKIKKLGYSVVEDLKALEVQKKKDLKKLKFLFTVAASCSIAILYLIFFPLQEGRLNLYLMMFFGTIAQFYPGGLFYSHAIKAIANKNYDMNVLVALGTSAAYFYSAFTVLFPFLFPEHLRYVYFDGASIIITFILLGKVLEENSKAKATDFMKNLIDLAPKTATIITSNGEEKTIKADTLQIGDIVIIKAGERVSADGTILEGSSDVDTSMITGEPLPQFKTVEDEVVAGTINTNGFLKVKVAKASNDTLLSHIITLLGEAQNQKMPIGRIADRISNIFVPTVISISILTFFIWFFAANNTLDAILASISVLIISCPCALGLATPIAIVSAVGKGAKNGILIKSPEVLEIIKDIKYAIFDKTGTITEGRISMGNLVLQDNSMDILNILASAELQSEHPISKAITNYAKEKQLSLDKEVKQLIVIPGKGIKCIIDDKEVVIGTLSFLTSEQVEKNEKYIKFIVQEQNFGNGAVLAAIDKKMVGAFSFKDGIKKGAKDMVQELKDKNIIPVLLTGDNEKTAKAVALKLGIEKVYAEVLPNEKYEVIKSFQKDDKVMFIGDGINDSPSLKQADIGLALGSGSDIAKDAGDIIIMNNELSSVIKSINLSIYTIRTVKQNLFWAFIYNALGIPIAAGALFPFFGIMLTPVYAGIAMSFSSVTVVLNSLRLKLKRL